MNSTKIITFDYLNQFNRIHVKITDSFFYRIKGLIKLNYKSIKKYSKFLGVSYGTIDWQFRKNVYHPFYRILIIIKDLNIPKEELYLNILGFYHWGSHNNCEVKIPMELIIDEFFVEGYALYLAEGDTGFSGKTRPRQFRFTNSNVNVINHMITWLNKYFDGNPSYILVNIPSEQKELDHSYTLIQINHDNLRFVNGYYNKIVKYNLLCERAVLIDLLLSIESTIKELCSKDPKLAAAYIRGMMIGEGTAYFNKSRYVRIEMKNEKEIKYIHRLLTMLGFDCKPVLRSNRHNMWSLYIGAKQLDKFAKEIGFGVHQERQQILEQGVNKVLKVNQYC